MVSGKRKREVVPVRLYLHYKKMTPRKYTFSRISKEKEERSDHFQLSNIAYSDSKIHAYTVTLLPYFYLLQISAPFCSDRRCAYSRAELI